MAGRPYVLEETTWKSVERTEYDLAVLPWGATEAHNYHLPYGTDTIQAGRVAIESARFAWEQGARVIVLPAVAFGVQSGQLDIPLCLHINPTTQLALLRDIASTLAGQGIRKLVILNGHGGNDFRAIVRELQPAVDIFVCTVNWYACIDASEFFGQPGDHAGELETSVLLHLTPDLVLPLDQAGSGTERRFRIEGLRDGWAWAPRHWRQVTADTGVGDPRSATQQSGARFFETATRRIGEFLFDLARTGIDDFYQ